MAGFCMKAVVSLQWSKMSPYLVTTTALYSVGSMHIDSVTA